jgi:hypothetical protein
MPITLTNLDLRPADLAAARDAIELMAYYHWIDAGCPEGQALDCWSSAEKNWIERCYVPSRPFDGTRPPSATQFRCRS